MNSNIVDKRTPGDWEAKDIYQGSADEIIAAGKRVALIPAYDKYGNKISDFEERKANAAFICKAVNSYDKLMASYTANRNEIDRLKIIEEKGNEMNKVLLQALQSVLDICGAANLSSFNQIKEAVRGSIEISDEAIKKYEQ